MKFRFSIILIFTILFTFGQNAVVESPNKKINITVGNAKISNVGNWHIQINYNSKEIFINRI